MHQNFNVKERMHGRLSKTNSNVRYLLKNKKKTVGIHLAIKEQTKHTCGLVKFSPREL